MRRTQARARVLAGAGGGDNPVLARLREIQVRERAEREALTTSGAPTAIKGGITTPADVRKLMGPSAVSRPPPPSINSNRITAKSTLEARSR